MSNYSTYQDAIKTAEESAGTSAAKYEAYMDSIEAHLNQVTTAWETFTQKLGQSDVIKKLVDASAFLISRLDRILSYFLTMFGANIGYKLSKGNLGIGSAAKNFLLGPGYGAQKQKEIAITSRLDGIKNLLKQIRDKSKKGIKEGDENEEDGNLKPSKKQKGKAALLAGIASGVSGFVTGPSNAYSKGLYGTKDVGIDDIESDAADKAINGVLTGGLAALGTYFLGPIGGVLGNIIGNEFGTLFKWLRHRDEIERKQRVQDALKVVDAINKANESVQKIESQVAKRGSSDFDATETWNAIYSTLNALYETDNGFEVIKDFEDRVGEALKQAGVGKEGDTAQNYLSLLVDGTDQQAEIVNRILSATLDLNKAFQTYASQEETRYQNSQSVDEVRKAAKELGLSGVGTIEDLLKELKDKYDQDYQNLSDKDREKLTTNITKLSKAINSYNEMAQEVNKSAFASAITMSGVSDWTSADMAVKSLDEAVIRIVDQVEESGAEVGIRLRDYNRKITKEARDDAISSIKNSGLGDLFKRETTPLFRLLEDKKERKEIASKLGKSFEEIIDEINTKSLSELEPDAEKLEMTTEQYRSYMLHLNDSTTELESFSKAAHISQNNLESHSELFDTTLQELTRSVSETVEAMNQMTSIVDNIISTGGLSVTILQDILKKAPSLLYKTLEDGKVTIDTSVENIFNNVWNKVMGQQADVLLSNAQIMGNLSDSNFIEAFKTSLKAAGRSDAEIAYLAGVSDLETILDDIREKGDDQILNALLSSAFTDDIENTKKILSQLSTYQTKIIENQIDNLNSQKEAISKVNDEYKKEIDLIKARQALENAKNEKKRVYRAGVGWTYEADQEAIQKAQEDLQQKENQVDEENLQYQIDLLEKEKSILNNLPSEMTLQRQKELFEVFGDSLSAGGISVNNFVVAIQNAYDKLNNIESPDTSSYTGSNTGVANAIDAGTEFLSSTKKPKIGGYGGNWYRPNGTKITGLAHYRQNAKKAGMSFEDYMVSKGYQHFSKDEPVILGEKGSEKWRSNANDYNTFLASLKDKDNGWFTKLHVGDWLNEDETAKTADELNKRYGLTGENRLDEGTIAQWVGLYNVYKDKNEVEIPDWELSSKGNYSLNGVYYNPNMAFWNGFLQNNQDMVPLKGFDGENSGKTLSLKQAETADTLIKLKQHLGSDRSNFAYPLVMYNGVLYYKKGDKWEAVDFEWMDLNLDEPLDSPYNKYIAAIWGNPNLEKDNGWDVTGKELEDYFLNLTLPNFEDKLAKVPSYAQGSYNFHGGTSLINELGTEGIVTPQGTLTALPAHAGIVPADLTRNLYQLGELAPTLIKRTFITDSLSGNRPFGNTEDNSMNVNQLYASFNVDNDFDFEKLLIQARQYMAMTKNKKL